MPRKKAARNVEIKPWLSGNLNNREGRFIQVGNSLLLSHSFQDLSAGARHLYLCLCMESGGNSHVTFPRNSAKKYGIPITSFDRYRAELVERGFIERVLTPDRERWAKAEFRFILNWKKSLE